MATKTRRLTTEAHKIRVGSDSLCDPYMNPHPVDSIVKVGHDAFGDVLDVYCTDGYVVTLSGSDRVSVVRTYA